MKPDWILIANASRARLLELESKDRVKELKSFAHPKGRSRVSELTDDRAGYQRTDRSFGAASFQPRTDPKQKEHVLFARELADYLEREAQRGTFASISVLASNPFLGELKAELGTSTKGLLGTVRNVDLTMVGKAELGRRVAQEMAY